MAKVVHALSQRRVVLGGGQRGVARFVPDSTVGDRGQLAAADAVEDATSRTDAEFLQVRAEEPGQRRRRRYSPPLSLGACLEAPLFPAATNIGPFGADLGCSRAKPQLS